MSGQQRVLVVEDTPAVRVAVRAVLEREGFRVDAAEDAEEALRRTAERDYDLVIVDMVLPRIGGRELAWRLRERNPAQCLLLISGIADAYSAEGLEQEPLPFLEKPFSNAELIAAVRSATDGCRKPR